MPRSDQFDYNGLSVSHAGGVDPVEFNQRSFHKEGKPEPKEGMGDVKGMVSPRQRRVHNPAASPEVVEETSKAAMKDWRNRGLSNSEIQDF